LNDSTGRITGNMKITLLRASCNNGRSCPNVNTTDRGTLVVQGYAMPPAVAVALGLAAAETVVEIPGDLLPTELVGPGVQLHPADHDTVMVVGHRVTDLGVLGELNLPPGEDVVEIAAAPLTQEVAHA
jgi:hypothetical protein